MNNKERQTLSRIREMAQHSIPKNGRAILYGSRARGNARPDSDWDILILLDKESLEQEDYTRISYPFVLLGCDLHEEINPIMYTTSEWQRSAFSLFNHNVMHDGIRL